MSRGPTIADPRSRALLDLVVSNPNSSEPKRVYADHSQELGDPHGELISLQLMGRPNAREQTLREELESQIDPLIAKDRYGRPKWRNGFVASCSSVGEATDLAHPAMRLVKEITIRTWGGWLERLCRAPLSNLESLTLSSDGCEPSSLLQVAKRFPQLKHLEIHGQDIGADVDLSPFGFLNSLALSSSSILDEFWDQFFEADFTKLRCFAVNCWSSGLSRFEPFLNRLLSGRDLPGLVEIGLQRVEESANLLRRVARSPLVGQLHRLRFEPASSYDETSDEEAMHECHQQLRHLLLIPHPGYSSSIERLAMLNSRFLGHHVEALELLDRADRVSEDSKERGEVLRRLGREADACFADASHALHFTNGHVDAFALAKRGLELRPNDVDGLSLLAKSVAAQGNAKRALYLANRALAIDPKAHRARVCRYRTHRSNGRWDAMIEDLNELLAAELPYASCFSSHKSDGHFCRGDLDGTWAAINEGLNRDRDDSSLLYDLLWLHVLAVPTSKLETAVSPLLERIERANRDGYPDLHISNLVYSIRTRAPRVLSKFSCYVPGANDLEGEIALAIARCQSHSLGAVQSALTRRDVAAQLGKRPAELAEAKMLFALISRGDERAKQLSPFLGDEIDPESLLRAFADAHPQKPKLRSFSANRFPNSRRDALTCAAISILASVLSDRIDQAQARLDALAKTREQYHLFPSTRTVRALLEVGAIKVRNKRGKELIKRTTELLYQPFVTESQQDC